MDRIVFLLSLLLVLRYFNNAFVKNQERWKQSNTTKSIPALQIVAWVP